MKKLRNLTAVFFAVLLTLTLSGCEDSGDRYLNAIRYEAALNADWYEDDPQEQVPLGAAFEDFFDRPHWEAFTSEDGLNIVEFTGYCLYYDEETKITVQFSVEDDVSDYDIVYCGYSDGSDDYALSDLEFLGLISNVIDSYNE